MVKNHISARQMKAGGIQNFDTKHASMLPQMGVFVAQDAQDLFTAPNTGAPAQFLQNWLPGIVKNVTTARKIDDLLGVTTAGDWADNEIVQMVMERTDEISLYGDYSNTPLSNYNINFEKRGIVRFETGFSVGDLERDREAKFGVDMTAAKREACVINLELWRNELGFKGYANTNVYGLLNDPNLPAYLDALPSAGGTTEWATKSVEEIQGDINKAMSDLMVASGTNVDPASDNITLAVAASAYQYLTSKANQFGITTLQWLNANFKNCRVIPVPEFDRANGNQNVFYLYAETLKGDSTDDGRTFDQIVPAKLKSLGTDPRMKGFTEGYSNALAGVLCKRPYLVQRVSGI